MNNSGMKFIILLILFVFTEFLGTVGFVSSISCRHIAVMGMLLYVLLYNNTFFKSVVMISRDISLFWILCIYYFIVMYVSILNNSILDVGKTFVFARFIPSLLIVMFLLVYDYKKNILASLSKVFITILIIDSLITILQSFDHTYIWNLKESLYTNNVDMLEQVDDQVTIFPSGLFFSNVMNGYFLCSFGMFFLLPVIKKMNVLNLAKSLISYILVLIALFLNQQRGAFYIYILLSIVLIFIYSRNSGNKKLLWFIIVGAILVIPLFLDMDWGRLKNFQDDDRIYLFTNFWSFYSDHLWLGDRHVFIAKYGTTPHNAFIDSFLLGGIIGMLCFSLFLLGLFCLLVNNLLFKRYNMIVVLSIFSLSALLGVSLTHSTGFHTGLTLSMYLLAYYFIILRHMRMNNRLNSKLLINK